MAIEAPISRYKKTNFTIYIAFCLVLAIWFAYDGYFNEEWIKEHTDANGNPETDLVINRKAPAFLIGAAALLGAYLLAVRNKKIIADENELVINGKERISYDSIQQIDKTDFKSKGRFIIIYKNKDDSEVNRKLSDRTYDNLAAILDVIVTKIS